MVEPMNKEEIKIRQNCPFFNELTKEEQLEYIQIAPRKTKLIWFALLLGIFGVIVIVVYYSYMNNEISKFNYQFKTKHDLNKQKNGN